uniref:Glucosidase II subunit alpha n=1 Tax=Trichuris muris TaxID=70415 RepID=A0A5S6QTV9_TRIMR
MQKELDDALDSRLKTLRQIWQQMGLSEEECLERELAVLQSAAAVLSEMELKEKNLLLRIVNEVEIKKRQIELLESELGLQKHDITFQEEMNPPLIGSLTQYSESVGLLETEKCKRMQLYKELENKMMKVCSRLGEVYEKLSKEHVPTVIELKELGERLERKIALFSSRCEYVPENTAHRELFFGYSNIALSNQTMADAKHFYDEMRAKQDENMKRDEITHEERLLRLHQCWDKCKIPKCDRTEFLQLMSVKSRSEADRIFEDEIRRLSNYYNLRKEIFEQVDNWLDLWNKKVQAQEHARNICAGEISESKEHGSLDEQLIEMQLNIKRSVDAWRRKNPGQKLCAFDEAFLHNEGYFHLLHAKMSRDKADIQQFRMIADQLRRELYIKRVLVSEAAKDLIKFVTEHQREDVLVSGFTSLKENPFRPKMLMADHILFALFSAFALCMAVDRGNFKQCSQSSFCRRQKEFNPGTSPYNVLPSSVSVKGSTLTAKVVDQRDSGRFTLRVINIPGGVARLILEEENPLRQRYRPLHALIQQPEEEKFTNTNVGSMEAVLESSTGHKVVITYSPLRVDLFSAGQLVISFNAGGLLNYERFTGNKAKPGSPKGDEPTSSTAEDEKHVGHTDGAAHEATEFDRAGHAVGDDANARSKEIVQETPAADLDEGLWVEHFKTHADSKPYGPNSVAADINFIGFRHVYGVPEHSDSVALRDTNQTDPYRLYNLDVFEYEVGNTMALYGSVPYIIAHNAQRTVGAFWLNSAEAWFDIGLDQHSSGLIGNLLSKFYHSKDVAVAKTHWMFESGIVDLFLLAGPTCSDVFRQYSTLTGATPIPPLFSLGYHVSRWNYVDTEDVRNVDANFDLFDIPYDTIWLDIEYPDGKRYFTWDPVKFANSEEMIKNLSAKGRKMVVVIDPHVKKDESWELYKEARDKDFYVKDKDGNVYEGWCWPGNSVYPDFANPAVREWYAHKYDLAEFKGSTEDLFIWNDMNEPSVFSGPEVTMPKDNLHFGNVEHREIHNTFALLNHMTTYKGLIDRSKGRKRPFILTRGFFIGSQRYAAVWTGDNTAEWSHMKISIPMVLTLGLAGIPFAGADIGGFFRNPDEEMIVRWHQVGAFHSFYRLHSELNTRRREPWVFSEKTRELIRNALRLRYSLLPYWYNLFYEHSVSGWPIMRPLWTMFPDDEHTFSEEEQFMVGNALMVMPVVQAGISSVNVYLPGKNSVWYDWDTQLPSSGPGVVQVFTPLEKIPLFIRGGCILPIRDRIRRASSLSRHDPITLLIALNKEGTFANGTFYLDDGESFDYKNGKYLHRYFEYTGDQRSGKLLSKSLDEKSRFPTDVTIEKVIVYGMRFYPRVVHLFDGDYTPAPLTFSYDNKRMTLTVRRPAVSVTSDFRLDVHS